MMETYMRKSHMEFIDIDKSYIISSKLDAHQIQ